jgi:hypothetical protein
MPRIVRPIVGSSLALARASRAPASAARARGA